MQVFKILNGQPPSHVVDLMPKHVPILAHYVLVIQIFWLYLAPLRNLVIIDLV